MEDVYERLRQKLDSMTKGYPKTPKGSELAFLKKVFTKEDAEIFIKFKRGLQTPEQVACDLGMSVEAALEKLESMSRKGLLYWERDGAGKKYRIVPFIHGIWEFNVDRISREDAVNMGEYYMNGYGKVLMDYHIPISRVVPIRADVVKDGKLLPVDDIEATIKKQKLIVACDCACRKVARFSKKPCPCTDEMNVCITFGQAAEYNLETNIGHPRILTVEQTLEILRQDVKEGRFLQAAHAKDCSGFCSCSKCHCGFLMAAKIHHGTGFESWSNYKCVKNEESCIDCGKCAERCPVKAMTVNEDDKAVYNRENCFGCGLCVTTCPTDSLILERKPDEQLMLPQDEKFFDSQDRMAVERAAIDKARREMAKAGK
jgi:Na+-translocating ferredoxin:NAD+ oxidoreductase subunit B